VFLGSGFGTLCDGAFGVGDPVAVFAFFLVEEVVWFVVAFWLGLCVGAACGVWKEEEEVECEEGPHPSFYFSEVGVLLTVVLLD